MARSNGAMAKNRCLGGAATTANPLRASTTVRAGLRALKPTKRMANPPRSADLKADAGAVSAGGARAGHGIEATLAGNRNPLDRHGSSSG